MRKNLLLHRLPVFLFSIFTCSFCFAQVTEAWVARYNGPGSLPDRNLDIAMDMAVDASGNVYVTGRSRDTETFLDYATIKYNASGIEQWVRRYNNGTEVTLDAARAIAVDALGNVYVTGESDQSTSSGNYDYVTIKYDTDGNELWVRRYDGPYSDHAHAIAVDALGNVYVTGESHQSTTPLGPFDYATVKYDPDGNEIWVKRYNGPADDNDKAYSLVIDVSGNVCVTGESRGNTSSDIATIKYDKDGNELWVRRYDNAEFTWDLKSMAVDPSLNVYVAGTSRNDFVTIKYDEDGTELWVSTYNGPGDAIDLAGGLAVDGFGNVYVAGAENGNFATVKYSSLGVQLWVSRYIGPGGDFPRSVAVDVWGNAYVFGSSFAFPTMGEDYATVKYNPAGVQLAWRRVDPHGQAAVVRDR